MDQRAFCHPFGSVGDSQQAAVQFIPFPGWLITLKRFRYLMTIIVFEPKLSILCAEPDQKQFGKRLASAEIIWREKVFHFTQQLQIPPCGAVIGTQLAKVGEELLKQVKPGIIGALNEARHEPDSVGFGFSGGIIFQLVFSDISDRMSVQA